MKVLPVFVYSILSLMAISSNAQIVKFDPFTKSNVVYGGLMHEKTIINLDGNEMLSQNIGLDQEIELKLKDLSGLESVEGTVYFGLKLELYKTGVDTALFITEDLYNGTGEFLVAEADGMESSVSPSYSLTFSKPYFIIGDTVTVKATFYDKKSDRSAEVTTQYFVVDGKIIYPENNFTTKSTGTALEFYSGKASENDDNFDVLDKLKAGILENNATLSLSSMAVNLSQAKKYSLKLSGISGEIISSSWAITNRFGDIIKTFPVNYKVIDGQTIVDMDWLKNLPVKSEQYFAILTLSNQKNFNSFVSILKFKVGV